MPVSLERVLIVMPAFNEQESVAGVIEEAQNHLPGAGLLVIDDGSNDATAHIARQAGARVLQCPFNLGVGGAMRLGFRYAQENKYSAVVQLDSDGQHNPADVPQLLALLDTTDVVIGARFAGSGDYEVRGPRKWAMRLLSRMLSSAVKTPLSDTTSGFKAHGPRAIEVFARDYPAEYLGDTVEALVIGHRAGLAFSQVGVVMRERTGGAPSHQPLKAAVYLGRVFFALCIAFLRPRRRQEGT